MANPVKNKKEAIISPKDFNLILRILKQNWWIPLIILPIFYGIGALYVYRLTTVYKASTEFLLKNDDAYYKNSVLNDAAFYSSSFVDNSNETRIIQSYDLASKVVDKLLAELQVSYFIVGKVRTTEQFNGMPFKILVHAMRPELYEKKFDLHVIDFDTFEIDYENEGSIVKKRGHFEQDLIDLDFDLIIKRSPSFTQRTAQSLTSIFYQCSVHTKEYLIDDIRSNLKIENPEYTQILKVTRTDVIPERAILILDTLNSVYAESKLKTRFELNERTVSYIDRQLNEIVFSLKSIEDTLQDYKQKKAIINLEWEETDFLSKIAAYDKKRSDAQMEIRALSDLEKYIIEDKDPPFLPPSVFVIEKTGFMNQAVQDLYSKQIELNRLYGKVKETNPAISELKAAIKKTKEDLLVYIHNSRKATVQQIASIDHEIADYIASARSIPEKQRDLLNIQRKANVNEQLYNFLLEKKASTKIARASIVPDIKIVEEPRYDGIDSPDKGKIQKQVLTLGMVMTIIVILLRAFLFSKIKSLEHLRDLTNLPVVGVLPFVKEGIADRIIVDEQPNSRIAESFRNFRTNLQYANVDVNAKTYLITSFLPGEGKTFTSVNLAALLAKSGKKTVLIELDLHKPRVFKRFGREIQTKGVTTFVTGGNSLDEIISDTHIPNLYCIYSGPIPPNPSEFVLSEKLKELLNEVKYRFDFVVIDSPPAGLLSDSVYLIQFADASIFVLNTRTSTKKVVTFVEDLTSSNNLRNVLLLLNGVAKTRKKYYYSGYGYSYGYGYGYGYGKGHSHSK